MFCLVCVVVSCAASSCIKSKVTAFKVVFVMKALIVSKEAYECVCVCVCVCVCLQVVTKAVPVKDYRDLGVSWSIPDLHPFYKTNVSSFFLPSMLLL